MYTKDFLISAYLHRFEALNDLNALERLYKLALTHYDQVGKDLFRKHASLDSATIQHYKNCLDNV